MKTPNIDFLLNFAQQLINGECSCLDFTLDFPYELEKRYKKACRENRDYAELIYDMLLEDGIYKADKLSDSDFKKLISHQLMELRDIAQGGFL